MINKRLFVSIFFAFISVIQVMGNAVDEKILNVPIKRIEEVVQLGFNMDISAWDKVDAIIADYPHSPVGLLIQTYGHLWDHIYGKNKLSISEWERSALQSLKFAQSYLSSHPDNVDAEFILAVNELGLAKYYIYNKQWFKALFKTRSGWSRVKKILKHNPEHSDTAYAVGMMNCYFDNTPIYLKPFAVLFGFKGDVNEGLKQLYQAAENGLLCRADARFSLWEVQGWLLNDWEASIKHMEELSLEFPRNVFFQNRLALSEAMNERQVEAVEKFKRVLTMQEIDRYIGTKIHSTYALASELNKLQQDEEVLKLTDQLLILVQEKDEYGWYEDWTYVLKGQTHNRLGQLKKSKENWTKVSSKYSDAHKVAKKALREMHGSKK